MPSDSEHLALAARNQELIDHLLPDIRRFGDWITVVAFYRALHLVEAVFFRDHPDKHGRNHESQKQISCPHRLTVVPRRVTRQVTKVTVSELLIAFEVFPTSYFQCPACAIILSQHHPPLSGDPPNPRHWNSRHLRWDLLRRRKQQLIVLTAMQC